MEDRNPPFECLIAEHAGDALGFALFFRTYSTWRGHTGLYLEDLFVLEQYRGCGIRQALLQRLAQITTARRWALMRWPRLECNTRPHNFSPPHRPPPPPPPPPTPLTAPPPPHAP